MVVSVDSYAVIGNPVSHSKSPTIHAMFAKSSDQILRYEALEVPTTDFKSAVTTFFNNGSKGLSVTIPFKEEAWALAEVKTDRAITAGAVNTLWLSSDGYLNGDNTDGIGLVRDLKNNHGITLKGAKILILGAGGAVRGVIKPLLNEQPREIVIANRTESKADTLIRTFSDESAEAKPTKLYACTFDKIDSSFDLIINGTAASLQGQKLPIPESVIAAHTLSYDMMYGATETVFNHWARESGARTCIDGLGMLVEQAAEQFLIWRGVRPDTNAVIKELRSAM